MSISRAPSTSISIEAAMKGHRNWTSSARAGFLSSVAVLMVACGITAPRSNEGYADLDSLGVFDTDRTMALSIGPTLIRIAAWAVDDDEPEIAAMLRDLDGVRIRIYEIDGNPQRVADRIMNMSKHLREDGWQSVVLVQEENEQTHMLIRARGDRISGLTLISSDGEEEAVIINLMGHLDPHNFSEVMDALDIESPDVEVAALD